MSRQHTPGKAGYTRIPDVLATNGALIAKCERLGSLATLQADARLIAAAPEMLSALECAVELLAQLVAFDRIPANNKALRDARAAIASATGEQQ
jgi:hypothetical protein